jgi:MFS family permease
VTRPQDRFRFGRRLGVWISAVLGIVVFVFFFSMVAAATLGLVETRAEGSPNDPPASGAARLGAARPGETVHFWGALAVLAVGGSGLVGLIGRPERSGHSYHVLAAMTGMLLTLPLVGNPDNYGGQAGWIDPVLLILILPSLVAALVARPWRHWRSDRWRPRFLVLAAIGAIPAAWYGVGQAMMQRNTFPPTADPHHNAHWWTLAMVAFMVVLVMAAAALPAKSWRLGPWVAGLAAIAIGLASLLGASSASAVPSAWAIPTVVWGLVGIWFAVRQTARERPSRSINRLRDEGDAKPSPG